MLKGQSKKVKVKCKEEGQSQAQKVKVKVKSSTRKGKMVRVERSRVLTTVCWLLRLLKVHRQWTLWTNHILHALLCNWNQALRADNSAQVHCTVKHARKLHSLVMDGHAADMGLKRLILRPPQVGRYSRIRGKHGRIRIKSSTELTCCWHGGQESIF